MAMKTIFINAGKRIVVDSLIDNKRACITFSSTSVEVLDDKCPHRGGPLHLCVKGPDGKKVCPWHGRPVKERLCTDFAVIYLPREGRAVIISDQVEGVPWPIKVVSIDN